MKNLFFIALAALFVFSCSNDDDVIVAQCGKPQNVLANNITFNSATIDWDNNNASSYTIEYGVSGFTLGTGTSADVSNNSADLSGLDANTTYDVYVRTNCSATNTSMYTDVERFTTAAPLVVPQFTTNLSDMYIYQGNMNDLNPSPYVFEYDLNTPLFTDYAHKQRLIALPPGTTMDYVDDGFPDFPDNTVITKSFYYLNDERDASQGKYIIETRVLIKIEGNWQLGNYKWNNDQTDAVLDDTSSHVLVDYIDANGTTQQVDYVIPSAQQCFDCHSNAGEETPIGPKLRTMNFNNQLQDFINAGHLGNLTDPSTVATLPDWSDDVNYTLEERARAYFDINCAHCHQDGGFCEFQSQLRLTYETPFAESYIQERSSSIDNRMRNYNEGFSMPLIGTTMVHNEGYALIYEYLNSL
ncbi:fibronectin type III domain-containing protein [Hanstruepera flava]|uniref:fibronectin type III domain-containing protein n=1 Tax=Hanstruepera flava TaxID=2930218 RepID=UPI0020287331|nr:hypothetical protein [Hanstruepera flava]